MFDSTFGLRPLTRLFRKDSSKKYCDFWHIQQISRFENKFLGRLQATFN